MKFSDRLTDQQQRNQQRQDAIIKGRTKPPIRFGTLGDRSSETGLYNVQDAAGGVKPSIKINNAEADQGGTYRITNDGVRSVADGKQGAAKSPKPRGDSLESRNVGRLLCNGYLNGQIFNCGEPEEGVPRGLIILTHTLFHLDGSAPTNPLPFEDANIFADTLFRYFSNDQGAIVYTAYDIDADPYLSINHTWLNPADVPTLEDIPVGAIVHYPGMDAPDEATRDSLIDYAKNKGCVIYALTFNETGSAEVATSQLANLGFDGQIEARFSLIGLDETNSCLYDPLSPIAENIQVGDYVGVFNRFVLDWKAHFWNTDNPIWNRYGSRFAGEVSTGYQNGAITPFVTTNGAELIFQPPVSEIGSSPSESGVGMRFTLYPIDDELQYFELTHATGSLRSFGTGVVCEPFYLSGIYFTPEQLP